MDQLGRRDREKPGEIIPEWWAKSSRNAERDQIGMLGDIIPDSRATSPGIRRLAVMLTVHLLRSYGSSARSPIPHRGGLAPRQVRRVLDYIEVHLTDELGLIDLAAIAGLSPHHFVEAFKISIGKPPHQFVMERRVQRVLELLRDEDRSIAQIAHAAGFSSQSHLTANFRRVTGVTPGRFRRSLS